MKFLIDRCAGVRLARWLREQGHDVVESRERGADPGDRALLQLAADERRILVTIFALHIVWQEADIWSRGTR